MSNQAKRKTYFILILSGALILLATFIAFIFVKTSNETLKSTIFVTIILVILFSMLFFKQKFDLYDFYYKHELLIKNSNNPLKSPINLTSPKWKDRLVENNYQIFKDNIDFKIYYRFEKLFKNKKSNAAIIIIEIVEDSITFNDPSVTKTINEFEDKFFKEQKFGHHIVLQFKNTEKFTQENVEESKNISFIKPTKNHYVIVVNVLFSLEEKKVYFLHSNTHNPNYYYNFASEEIKKLI